MLDKLAGPVLFWQDFPPGTQLGDVVELDGCDGKTKALRVGCEYCDARTGPKDSVLRLTVSANHLADCPDIRDMGEDAARFRWLVEAGASLSEEDDGQWCAMWVVGKTQMMRAYGDTERDAIDVGRKDAEQ